MLAGYYSKGWLLSVKQESAIFGTVVAVIVCGGGALIFKRYAANMTLAQVAAICLPAMAACLALAWLLDRRASARAKREQSGHS